MAVKIKLARIGKRSDPKYNIVVMEAGKKVNGRYIEKIGRYDPIPDPHILNFDKEKLKNWLGKGAQMSKGIKKLLKSWKNF